MKGKIVFLALLVMALSWPLRSAETNYRTMKLLSTGWVKGTVAHTLKNLELPKIETNFDRTACGEEPRVLDAVQISPSGALQNVVVYLEDITAGKEMKLAAEPPALNQKHCTFEPHVQVVPAFSSIKILNNDETLHSVHAFQYGYDTKFVLYPNSIIYPARTLFNIAMVAQRKESFQQLGGPGVVKFICEAGHNWMTAYAVVASHTYFVKVNKDGAYALEDVPPGKYTLVAWHEYFGTKKQKIEVKANQPTTQNFVYNEEL